MGIFFTLAPVGSQGVFLFHGIARSIMTPYQARRVTVDARNQEFVIEWLDGHRTVFPLDGLRRSCPCASCSGGHDQIGQLPDPEIFRVPALMRWDNVRVEAVGAYGLRFIWDDGHNAGIYTWERLRITCPCPACQASREQAQ